MESFFEAFIQLVVYVCISGFISNIIGYLLPRDQINSDMFPYTSLKFEREGKIYLLFKVRKWKNKVPDMSKVLKSLYPKAIASRPSPEQIQRLIQETCVAELVHTLLIVSSPLVKCFVNEPYEDLFTVLYILGNIPYIIIQRYNRPAFKNLYNNLVERQNRQQLSGGETHESADIVL